MIQIRTLMTLAALTALLGAAIVASPRAALADKDGKPAAFAETKPMEAATKADANKAMTDAKADAHKAKTDGKGGPPPEKWSDLNYVF
jgi:hypothetical protein